MYKKERAIKKSEHHSINHY